MNLRMKTKSVLYWGVFLVLVLVNLWGPASWFVWTKPLLVPGIALGFGRQILAVPRALWLCIALFFGWLGDAFLLIPDQFIWGLGAFLIGHVAYIVGLFPTMKGPWRLLGPILIFGGMMAFQLYQRIPAALMPPVFVYMAVICLMALVAFRQGNRWLEIGSLLFLFSDSILAWNKFIGPLPAGGIVVMASYISAQWLLVKGWVSKEITHVA